MNEKTW